MSALLTWLWKHKNISIPEGYFEFLQFAYAVPKLPEVPPYSLYSNPNTTYSESLIRTEVNNSYSISYYYSEKEEEEVHRQRKIVFEYFTNEYTGLWVDNPRYFSALMQ